MICCQCAAYLELRQLGASHSDGHHVPLSHRAQGADYMELIRKQDRDGLMALLTDRAVERKVCAAASQPLCSASFARRICSRG